MPARDLLGPGLAEQAVPSNPWRRQSQGATMLDDNPCFKDHFFEEMNYS
jgi:hypothetical protein